MNERDDAWQTVADRFRTLGQGFRDHFEQTGQEREPGTSEDVKRALQDLGVALDRVFTATGNALRDEQVREEGKHAAAALGEALGATFAELGEDLRRVVGRGGDDVEHGSGTIASDEEE